MQLWTHHKDILLHLVTIFFFWWLNKDKSSCLAHNLSYMARLLVSPQEVRVIHLSSTSSFLRLMPLLSIQCVTTCICLILYLFIYIYSTNPLTKVVFHQQFHLCKGNILFFVCYFPSFSESARWSHGENPSSFLLPAAPQSSIILPPENMRHDSWLR